MFALRCTKKLLDCIPGKLIEPGPSDTLLGDWYANLGQMGEDAGDGDRVFDGRDELELPTTMRAVLDIDIGGYAMVCRT